MGPPLYGSHFRFTEQNTNRPNSVSFFSSPSRLSHASPKMTTAGRHLLPSVALLALLFLQTASTSSTPAFSCPRGCGCNETTITCTDLTGLRTIDKTLPIQRLVLAGLQLSKIPPQLENIRNITELDLSDNQLAEVNHLGKRIRKLNLARNRITSGKLAKIPLYVESLNLTHNEITYLPLALMKLKKLRYIELANNPINCTCETLHIRNWLTTRHVWSDEHIKCSAPQEFKGRPWLQVKQADVCHAAAGRTGGYNWDDYEDENELMLGDQANLDEGEEEEDQDDLKKEYIQVGEKAKTQEPPIDIQNDEEQGDEGSGDGSSPNIGEEEATETGEEKNGTGAVRVGQIQNAVEKDDEEDDGSGSGGGILSFGAINVGDTSEGPQDSDITAEDDGASEEKPITSPSDGLGIFGVGLEEDTTSSPSVTPTESSEVIPLVSGGRKQDSTTSGTAGTPVEENQKIQTADSDSQGTYILLAILGIILVSLIILVICKRKPDARNRRDKADLESARGRELQDMDKSLLGKPVEKNGHNPPERMPLMNDRKSDFDKVFDKPNNYPPAKPERTSLDKPSLDSFKPVPADRNKSPYENVPPNNNNNNNTVPLANGNGTVPVRNGDPAGVHQTQNNNVPSSQNDDDVFLPPTAANGNLNQLEPPATNVVDSPKSKRYSPIYVPTSPKSDRYSPVYSPETGRVKIKLTETPKPKTPILVTRSRSRAGEYITTPDQKF